ncbi:MAG: AAA family ATPase [Candidatus Micrarchaeota archaeon]|nr:AAA family ATPase [Candidatus Micrarchaeota archaeon]
MILCLTGMPGSGKTTAAGIFEKMGFEVIELSGIIKAEMTSRGIKPTNRSIEDFANKMKASHGSDFFSARVGKMLKAKSESDVLVVGFRSIAEFESVERAAGSQLVLIVVSVPQRLRFKRLSERKELPIKGIEQLIMRDKSNIGMGILNLLDHADFVVSNTGTKKELEASIHEVLDRIGEAE